MSARFPINPVLGLYKYLPFDPNMERKLGRSLTEKERQALQQVVVRHIYRRLNGDSVIFYEYQDDITFFIKKVFEAYGYNATVYRLEFITSCGDKDYFLGPQDEMYQAYYNPASQYMFTQQTSEVSEGGIYLYIDYLLSDPRCEIEKKYDEIIKFLKEQALLQENYKYVVAKIDLPGSMPGYWKVERVILRNIKNFKPEDSRELCMARFAPYDNRHVRTAIDELLCIVSGGVVLYYVRVDPEASEKDNFFNLLVRCFTGFIYEIGWRKDFVFFVNPEESYLFAALMVENDLDKQEAIKRIYKVLKG